MSYETADTIKLTQYDFSVIEEWVGKHMNKVNSMAVDYSKGFGIDEFIMYYKGSNLIRYEEGQSLTKKKNYKIPKERYDQFMTHDKDKINLLNGFSHNSFPFISKSMLEKYLKLQYSMINSIYNDRKLSKKQKFVKLVNLGCIEMKVYVRIVDKNTFRIVIGIIDEKLDMLEVYADDEIPTDDTIKQFKGDIIKENLFRTLNAVRCLVMYTHHNITYLDKFIKSTRNVRKNKGNTVRKNKYKLNRKYSLNKIVRVHYDNNRDNPTRRNNAYIQEWSVRGHWRTYKNGKKVWIKPHRCSRPEESGATESYSGKEYELEMNSR